MGAKTQHQLISRIQYKLETFLRSFKIGKDKIACQSIADRGSSLNIFKKKLFLF
jgi:hypothetical protein